MIYHLIGIKGAGMCALACFLHDYGYEITGSDVLEDFFTKNHLDKRQIKILPFSKDNINKDRIIIVSSAFIGNEEHQYAMQLQCEIYEYHEFLGKLSREFISVVVSGSHGKTTTTNLIRQILEFSGDINYIVGDGQGKGTNDSDLFVFEACEYRRHFLAHQPEVACITNIDFDHPDYYQNIGDVQEAFQSFIDNSNIIIYNGDDALLSEIIPSDKQSFSYGLKHTNDYYADNISNDQQFTYFDLYIDQKYNTTVTIPLFGVHSVYNALAAIAVSKLYLENINSIKERLKHYISSQRRFQEFIIRDQVIINDYAHHPKEIAATIDAVKSKYPFKKILIYFQPHTYTRTHAFLTEFAEVLQVVNRVFLREIFSSARENKPSINIFDLQSKIKGSRIINDDSFIDEFKQFHDYVVLFMGAGDIDLYYNKYIESF